jgi:hypothetical protein
MPKHAHDSHACVPRLSERCLHSSTCPPYNAAHKEVRQAVVRIHSSKESNTRRLCIKLVNARCSAAHVTSTARCNTMDQQAMASLLRQNTYIM